MNSPDSSDGDVLTDATDGTDGTDATTATDGTTGTDATTATDGTDGTDGADGTDGTDGSPFFELLLCAEGTGVTNACAPVTAHDFSTLAYEAGATWSFDVVNAGEADGEIMSLDATGGVLLSGVTPPASLPAGQSVTLTVTVPTNTPTGTINATATVNAGTTYESVILSGEVSCTPGTQSAVLFDTEEDGNLFAWTQTDPYDGGVWSFLAGTVSQTAPVDYSELLRGTATSHDYELKTSFELGADAGVLGLIARHSEAGYYEVRLDAVKDEVSLYKVTGETEVALAQPVTKNLDQSKPFAYSVRVIGDQVTVLEGEDVVFTKTDPAPLPAGRVGLCTKEGATATFLFARQTLLAACASTACGADCGQNGVCQVGFPTACACDQGWTGDDCGTDVKECALDLDNCVVNSTCFDDAEPGTFECECNEGYAGDATIACENVDECATPADNNCNANASCDDTIGGFECTCNEGYKGNGVACEDKDECGADGGALCGTTTLDCANTVGSYLCTCTDGLEAVEGDTSIECENIDECTADAPCGANTVCTNIVKMAGVSTDADPVYTCQCAPGYEGDPVVGCTEINECEPPEGGSPCPENATCTDLMDDFQCDCDPGYESDDPKVSCTEIDECIENAGTCGPLLMCNDLVNGFECICHPGTVPDTVDNFGNPVDCADVDECAEGTHDCDLANDVCINENALNLSNPPYTCQNVDEFLCDSTTLAPDYTLFVNEPSNSKPTADQWTWTTKNGNDNWVVSNGELQDTVGGLGGAIASYGQPNFTDMSVVVEGRPFEASSELYIVARSKTGGGYTGIITQQQLCLNRKISATNSTSVFEECRDATPYFPTPSGLGASNAEWVTMRLRVHGTRVVFTVNNQHVIAVDDVDNVDNLQGAGAFGLRGGGAAFDNFVYRTMNCLAQ